MLKRSIFTLLMMCLALWVPMLAQAQVKLEAVRFKNNFVQMNYPKLQGLEDPVAQAKINSQIEWQAKEFAGQVVAMNEPGKGNYTGWSSYRIRYLSASTLSITITYAFYLKESARPCVTMRGLTFDLSTGEKRPCMINPLNMPLSEVNASMRMYLQHLGVPLDTVRDLEVFPAEYYLDDNGHTVFIVPEGDVAGAAVGIIEFPV